MKPISTYIRLLLITAVTLFCFQNDIFSQEEEVVPPERPGFYFGFSGGPIQTDIYNAITLNGSEIFYTKQNSYSGSVEFGYYFSRFFGFSSGIDFNSYKALLTLDTYQNNNITTDSEKESYEQQVTGSGISEMQKADFISLPFSIIIRIPLGKTLGIFLQPGVNIAKPVNNSYSSSGSFTYKGYYPAYNVLLENLPAYGFPVGKSTTAEGTMELSPFNFNAVASAGIDFMIHKKVLFGVAACYSRSLTGISDNASPDTFILSPGVDQINSLMGGTASATTEAIGIKAILRIYLK